MGTARYALGGAGTQTAAVAFGGGSPVVGNTESWNGTSWTAGNTMNTAIRGMGAFGTQTAAVSAGGITGTPPLGKTNTELWNGTSWTTSPATLATGRWNLSGSGTQASGLAFGGNPGPGAWGAQTEEWNFGVYSYSAAAWASGGNINTARRYKGWIGTQTAALAFGGGNPGGNLSASESYNGIKLD
jgi:hypothetical protein